MTRLVWDQPFSREYEAGVDRGVFYPVVGPGIPWNGLLSVVEKEDSGSQNVVYVDGVRYVGTLELSAFAATISAVTYPEEFEPYDGYEEMFSGQKRDLFAFSYRSLIGNGSQEAGFGYRIHLVYQALVDPKNRDYSSLTSENDISTFEWDLTTIPVAIPDLHASSHLIIDSRCTHPDILSTLEGWLYGTPDTTPRMPSIPEILELFDGYAQFIVTDNGDGTATVTGPDDAVFPLGYDDLWTLSYISVLQINSFTFRASSY